MRRWRRWAASYEGLEDEAWRYGLLSGVENEVERSSIKRKAFPSGVQLHSANSILGLVQRACFSWLENLLEMKLSNPLKRQEPRVHLQLFSLFVTDWKSYIEFISLFKIRYMWDMRVFIYKTSVQLKKQRCSKWFLVMCVEGLVVLSVRYFPLMRRDALTGSKQAKWSIWLIKSLSKLMIYHYFSQIPW